MKSALSLFDVTHPGLILTRTPISTKKSLGHPSPCVCVCDSQTQNLVSERSGESRGHDCRKVRVEVVGGNDRDPVRKGWTGTGGGGDRGGNWRRGWERQVHGWVNTLVGGGGAAAVCVLLSCTPLLWLLQRLVHTHTTHTYTHTQAKHVSTYPLEVLFIHATYVPSVYIHSLTHGTRICACTLQGTTHGSCWGRHLAGWLVFTELFGEELCVEIMCLLNRI